MCAGPLKSLHTALQTNTVTTGFRVKNCSSSHFCCCWCFSSAADEVKEEYTKNYFIVKRKKVLKTTKTCSKLSPRLFLSQDHCHVTYRSQEVSHTCLGILVTILTPDTHRVFLGGTAQKYICKGHSDKYLHKRSTTNPALASFSLS